jgi:hypothetical protein
MAIFIDNTVWLGYVNGVESEALSFSALYANDEDFEIISIPKVLINWTIKENIIGYRNIYKIRIQNITYAQRTFLYKFIQAAIQSITMNDESHFVKCRDKELNLDLLDNYIGNLVLEMELEDASITNVPTPTFPQGMTSNSYGYSSPSELGTTVLLSYNYGSGDTKRFFRVNKITTYKAEILDKRWKYVDYNNGYKRLGFRLMFDIDFGGFGLGQTQIGLQDDRNWLKEFVLAPTKRIEGYGQYIAEVVNDFNTVSYDLIGGIIYGKTTRLQFKAKELATTIPLETSFFQLDSGTLGILDQNVLG